MGSKRVIYVNGPYIAEQHIGTQILHAENVYNSDHFTDRINTTNANRIQTEDVEAVDTSFFCTERYDAALCEKNLREAIEQAKSKADACRKVMQLETCGYIRLSNVTDERKAELVNPFAAPKYRFSGEDFRKARNN